MAEIIPAILTNDVFDFRKKYSDFFALSHYFSKLHVDFSDGEFVPSKTIVPRELSFLRSPFTLIAHFMTYRPQIYFEQAKEVGFTYVLFHYEAFGKDAEIEEAINAAENLGLKIGLVLNPETPLYKAGKFIPKVDLVQLMGINPGFQGRAFITSTIEKIKELRTLTKDVIICVDGGVRVGIARACVKAGADYLVSGSAILRSEDKELALEALLADIET
ncbi:MAG: hypothetical protein HY336_01295 [Candidatus Doudnabacteria bacterium]|nr:hypothetical protein [Candidatus Doudnabacteria bacterium]